MRSPIFNTRITCLTMTAKVPLRDTRPILHSDRSIFPIRAFQSRLCPSPTHQQALNTNPQSIVSKPPIRNPRQPNPRPVLTIHLKENPQNPALSPQKTSLAQAILQVSFSRQN